MYTVSYKVRKATIFRGFPNLAKGLFSLILMGVNFVFPIFDSGWAVLGQEPSSLILDNAVLGLFGRPLDFR